jgi:hypothetical protein
MQSADTLDEFGRVPGGGRPPDEGQECRNRPTHAP